MTCLFLVPSDRTSRFYALHPLEYLYVCCFYQMFKSYLTDFCLTLREVLVNNVK